MLVKLHPNLQQVMNLHYTTPFSPEATVSLAHLHLSFVRMLSRLCACWLKFALGGLDLPQSLGDGDCSLWVLMRWVSSTWVTVTPNHTCKCWQIYTSQPSHQPTFPQDLRLVATSTLPLLHGDLII